MKEEDLDHLIYELAQRICTKSKGDIFSAASKILNQVISDTTDIEDQRKSLVNELKKIETDREVLLDKYLDTKIEDELYQMKDAKLKERKIEIQEKWKELAEKKNAVSDKKDRVKELENEINTIIGYDMSVDNIKNHIEKIVVYPNNMIIHFDIFDDIIVTINKINYRKTEYHICW